MKLSEFDPSIVGDLGIDDIDMPEVMEYATTTMDIAWRETVASLVTPLSMQHNSTLLTHWFCIGIDVHASSPIGRYLAIREQRSAKDRIDWVLRRDVGSTSYRTIDQVAAEVSNGLIEFTRRGVISRGTELRLRVYTFHIAKPYSGVDSVTPSTTRPPRTPMVWKC